MTTRCCKTCRTFRQQLSTVRSERNEISISERLNLQILTKLCCKTCETLVWHAAKVTEIISGETAYIDSYGCLAKQTSFQIIGVEKQKEKSEKYWKFELQRNLRFDAFLICVKDDLHLYYILCHGSFDKTNIQRLDSTQINTLFFCTLTLT